jgi:ribonuclease HII
MKAKELERLERISAYERSCREKGYRLIGGIDEAGRGPLAGPVVAACVILPEGFLAEGVNDSKKVPPERRERLFDVILEAAVAVGTGIVDGETIDRINILQATKLAMRKAVEGLGTKPDILLIDALRLEDVPIDQMPIVKGDAKSISIAAASIVAKVTRDRIMIEWDRRYPEYGFARHKGYGTAEHLEAIRRHGVCEIHRKTFTGCRTDEP